MLARKLRLFTPVVVFIVMYAIALIRSWPDYPSNDTLVTIAISAALATLIMVWFVKPVFFDIKPKSPKDPAKERQLLLANCEAIKKSIETHRKWLTKFLKYDSIYHGASAYVFRSIDHYREYLTETSKIEKHALVLIQIPKTLYYVDSNLILVPVELDRTVLYMLLTRADNSHAPVSSFDKPAKEPILPVVLMTEFVLNASLDAYFDDSPVVKYLSRVPAVTVYVEDQMEHRIDLSEQMKELEKIEKRLMEFPAPKASITHTHA